MKFRSTARRITSDMTDITDLIAGEHGRHASTVLNSVLGFSHDMDGRITQSGEALTQVRGLARRIRLDFEGLANRVFILQTLCTLTRIETSRLGNAGADFCDLSAEVKPLSEIIRKSGEGVIASASELDQGVRFALRIGSDLRGKQLKELPALIDGVMMSLKAFEERTARAAEASKLQARQYGAICESIDDLVRSVQFHDITRQQIEHVVEALQHIQTEQAARDENPDAPLIARGVLTLQLVQLSRAAQLFLSSVKNMQRDLENIAARVKQMAESSRDLMGLSTDDQSSFFAQMETQFTAILDMLAVSAEAQTGIEDAGSSLEQIIHAMETSIEEIRGVEIRIQRIATNATIQAAHIGHAGDALSVIAEVMQGMALESNKTTEHGAGALKVMNEATIRVSGRTTGADSISVSKESLTGEMRGAVTDLHLSSESARRQVHEIAALGTRLAEDIDAVRNNFSAGDLFEKTVARVRSEFERLGAQSGEGAAAIPSHLLEHLSKSYTMQSEREVHESIARGEVIEVPAVPESSAVAVNDGDLGNNVELF